MGSLRDELQAAALIQQAALLSKIQSMIVPASALPPFVPPIQSAHPHLVPGDLRHVLQQRTSPDPTPDVGPLGVHHQLDSSPLPHGSTLSPRGSTDGLPRPRVVRMDTSPVVHHESEPDLYPAPSSDSFESDTDHDPTLTTLHVKQGDIKVSLTQDSVTGAPFIPYHQRIMAISILTDKELHTSTPRVPTAWQGSASTPRTSEPRYLLPPSQAVMESVEALWDHAREASARQPSKADTSMPRFSPSAMSTVYGSATQCFPEPSRDFSALCSEHLSTKPLDKSTSIRAPLSQLWQTEQAGRDLLGTSSYMDHTLGALHSLLTQIPSASAEDAPALSQAALTFVDLLSSMTRDTSRQAGFLLSQSVLLQRDAYLHQMAPRYKTPEILNTLRLAPWKGPSLFGGFEKSVVDNTKDRIQSSRTLHGDSPSRRAPKRGRPVPVFNLTGTSPLRPQGSSRGQSRGGRGSRRGGGSSRASASESRAPPSHPDTTGVHGHLIVVQGPHLQ